MSMTRKDEMVQAVKIIMEEKGFKEITNKTYEALLDTIFEVIQDNLGPNSKVAIKGFGTFDTLFGKERTVKPGFGKNGTVQIPSKYRVRFKPSMQLKDRVNAIS